MAALGACAGDPAQPGPSAGLGAETPADSTSAPAADLPAAAADTTAAFPVYVAAPPPGTNPCRIDLKLEDLEWNGSWQSPQFPVDAGLAGDRLALAGSAIEGGVLCGYFMCFQFFTEAFHAEMLMAIAAWQAEGAKGRPPDFGDINQKDVRIVLAQTKDAENADLLWLHLRASIPPDAERLQEHGGPGVHYLEFAGPTRAVCFYVKDLWFTFVSVAAVATEGDLGSAEALRDEVLRQVVALFEGAQP
ncbi:MAG: hypothetical protein AB1505_33625 [Candidatus Latescibacterota bacterium]